MRQDVMVPVNRSFNNDVIGKEEQGTKTRLLEVALAIIKVGILFSNIVRSTDSKWQLRKFIRAVCASPQHG